MLCLACAFPPWEADLSWTDQDTPSTRSFVQFLRALLAPRSKVIAERCDSPSSLCRVQLVKPGFERMFELVRVSPHHLWYL